MVSREDLKSILVLRYLNDEMLDKIIPIVDVLRFDEREVIFREGDKGIRFYLLKRGKVVLEKRISDRLSFSAGSVKPGYSFGWSAMLEEGDYTLDAVAAEPCEVYSIKGEKIKKLLSEDHTMGYIMTQGLLRVLKRRLDHRTEQFIRVLTQHPDVRSLDDEKKSAN
jgi:CRP-like cAMP-binding protein